MAHISKEYRAHLVVKEPERLARLRELEAAEKKFRGKGGAARFKASAPAAHAALRAEERACRVWVKSFAPAAHAAQLARQLRWVNDAKEIPERHEKIVAAALRTVAKRNACPVRREAHLQKERTAIAAYRATPEGHNSSLAAAKKWAKANPGQVLASVRARENNLTRAIPDCLRTCPVERAEVNAIYAWRDALRAVGLDMHVHHEYPLKGAKERGKHSMSGLNIARNMQVVPAKENMRLGNRVWPDMP